MHVLICILALMAALAFGGVVWYLDHPIVYGVVYLAFFTVCGWAARKGKKHGRED